MNGQILMTLVKMQFKKLIRTPANLFLSILFPVVLTAIFGLSFTPDTGMSISADPKVASGLISYAIIFLIMTVAMSFAEDREQGLLKRINTTPTTSTEFMGSHIISNMMIALVQVALVFGIALLFGFNPTGNAGSYILSIITIALFSLSSVGLGLITATIAKNPGAATGISFLFIMPQMFFGTFIPLNTTTEVIAVALPSFHATEALTSLFAGVINASVFINIAYIAGFSIVVVILGILLFKKYGNA